jgi:hypothetical protein
LIKICLKKKKIFSFQEEQRRQEDERRRMEREKRQEFVERTKNLLTAAESQGTEKSQRSTGGTKKVLHFCVCGIYYVFVFCFLAAKT